MAAAAMKEVRWQLQEQGGKGQVWIENWNQRFAGLGSLREFLESRTDVKVIPGAGKKFSVALASGGAQKGKGKGSAAGVLALTNGGGAAKVKGKGNATVIPKWAGPKSGSAPKSGNSGSAKGWDPLVAEAIKEIKGQLLEQGGAGKVWVDNWKVRFGDSLGEMREFLESRADKFQVIPTGGKSFMVALAGIADGAQPRPGKSPQSTLKPQAKAKSKDSAGEAVKEVRAQLKTQGGSGIVWIDNWKARFGTLAASPREFIEMRPEFEIVPGEGKKFTVKLAGNSGVSNKRKLPWEGEPTAKKAKKSGTSQTLEEEAIAEVTKQLSKQANKEGKVWVKNWNSKFKDELGPLREFLENHGEKFLVTVEPGEGNKFTVALL